MKHKQDKHINTNIRTLKKIITIKTLKFLSSNDLSFLRHINFVFSFIMCFSCFGQFFNMSMATKRSQMSIFPHRSSPPKRTLNLPAPKILGNAPSKILKSLKVICNWEHFGIGSNTLYSLVYMQLQYINGIWKKFCPSLTISLRLWSCIITISQNYTFIKLSDMLSCHIFLMKLYGYEQKLYKKCSFTRNLAWTLLINS